MYPTDAIPESRGFYPPDSVINEQTTRNDDAVLYFVEQAACPYRAADARTTDCGPLYDDFESGAWLEDQRGRHGHGDKRQRSSGQCRSRPSGDGVKQLAWGNSAASRRWSPALRRVISVRPTMSMAAPHP